MVPFWLDAPQTDVQDLLVVDGVVWVVDAAGLHARDTDGTLLARVGGLPGPVLCAGVHRGELAIGTEDGAFQWRDGWVAVGPRRAVVAVTEDAIVYRSGETIGAVRSPAFTGMARAALQWQDGLVVGLADGRLVLPWGTWTLDAPVADLTVVDGELRVAAHTAAYRVAWGQPPLRLDVRATAAGAHWGTADGRLVDDDGRRVMAIDGPVDAVVAVGKGTWAGGPKGLWMLDEGATRVTPEKALCGGHITGLAQWRGALVVGTFDRGACVRDPSGAWHAVEGLPSPMVNDVLVQGDVLWIATAAGLVRIEGSEVTTIGQAQTHTGLGPPGLHHSGANELALDPEGGLWIADLNGPIEVRDERTWRRWRLHVSGRSYQTIAACDDGSVWVGSEDDGLAVLGTALGRRNGRSDWRHVNVSNGLPQDWVMAVACGTAGSAWVGTYSRGVGRLSSRGWEPVVGLEHLWVQDLAVRGDTVWVAAAQGLFRVQGDAVTRVMTTDVHTLLSDASGLWVGAASGVWWLADEPGADTGHDKSG